MTLKIGSIPHLSKGAQKNLTTVTSKSCNAFVSPAYQTRLVYVTQLLRWAALAGYEFGKGILRFRSG